MNPVGSYTESVSARSTKSSAAPSDASGTTPVSEVGADGERSREFADFLEPVPSQPASTGTVGEPAAPVVTKPVEGWTLKSLASLMSLLDQPPPADPALAQVADEMPDDAASVDQPDETILAVATVAVDPLAMPVALPPPPLQNSPQTSTTEAASLVAEPTGDAAPKGRALETTAAPPQPAVQSAAHSATQTTAQSMLQPRRAVADTSGGRAAAASTSVDAPLGADRRETDTPAPLDRTTVAAQREPANKDARPQPELPSDGESPSKTDGVSAPRTDAPSSLKSASSAEASEHEDAFKTANVKSVSQETHMMLPSHRTEPARQIGAAVVAEVAQTASAQPAEATRPSDPLVKVLDLHLEPRELGAVHVRLHLSHGAMTLSVKVETEELASRLQRDSDILTKMLQSSGITLDGLVVQSLGVERSTFSGNDPSMGQKNQDAQSNQANANSSGTDEGRGRGDESGEGGRRQGDGTERSEPASPAPSRTVARAAGAIYI